MPEPIDLNDRRMCRVHFACNDPDSGQSTGRCERVEFEMGGDVEVSISGEPIEICFRIRTVAVAKRVFRHLGYRQSVGNWCWDAVELNVNKARAILAILLGEGWRPEEWHSTGCFVDLIEAKSEVMRA